MANIEALLNESRLIITRHKESFEEVEEYYDILEEHRNLTVLHNKENPLQEPVPPDEVEERLVALVNKYFDFESKYEYAKFSSGKKDYALVARTLSYIAIIIGTILALVISNFLVFSLIFVTAFLVLRECRFDERFFFIPRNINSYPFEYLHYCIIVGIITIICFLYLFSHNYTISGWIFLSAMTLETGLLLPYQKEIEKLKLRKAFSDYQKDIEESKKVQKKRFNGP